MSQPCSSLQKEETTEVSKTKQNTKAKGNQKRENGLIPTLKRLDQLLEHAMEAAQAAYGPNAAADRFRGLYVSQEEVQRLFAREPGAPVLWVECEDSLTTQAKQDRFNFRLSWLKKTFGLSVFELDILVIALAPEIDLRYERLYAYLQDDITKKKPTVDLALNLLCPTTEAKVAGRVHFAVDAPLIRHSLLLLIGDPNQNKPPLLSHALKVDEQIVNLILGQARLDARLASCCNLSWPLIVLEGLPLPVATKDALRGMVRKAWETRHPLRVYFHGAPGTGKLQMAEALAAEVGAPMLVVDLVRALASKTDFDQLLRLIFREAWFQDALLFLEGWDAVTQEPQSIAYPSLLEELKKDGGITLMAGTKPWDVAIDGPNDIIIVAFPMPELAERKTCWQANLTAKAIELSEPDLTSLADRFKLTPMQIHRAVEAARNQVHWQAAGNNSNAAKCQETNKVTLKDLFAAARAQSGQDLALIAKKIQPKYTWDDIVLPDDIRAQLQEICQRVAHRNRVLGEWGFDAKLSLGKGVNALFAGPSGTGKTMAAEIIANELGLDLYKIDLSGVVSKYIGETEKNLDRIIRAAENNNAILFFDEADALFGKRSEVRDSHDRYANIEISYLLQKMEEYDGIAILATNLRQNLDEAFTRRLVFTVHFPFPNEASRQRIWTGIWPSATPIAEEVDLAWLSRQFKLSGGNIKNIALAAAFLAAEDGGVVTMTHLRHATKREYQKMGKALSEMELNGVPSHV